MPLATWLIGTLVVGAGVTGGALVARAALKPAFPISVPPDLPIPEKKDAAPHQIIEFNTLADAMTPQSGALRGRPGVSIMLLAKGEAYAKARPVLEELSRQHPDVTFVQLDMDAIQGAATGRGFVTEGIVVGAGPIGEKPVQCALLTKGPQTLTQKLAANRETMPEPMPCREVDTRNGKITFAALSELVDVAKRLKAG